MTYVECVVPVKNMSYFLAELTALTHYKYMSIKVTINVLYDTELGGRFVLGSLEL